MDHPLLFNEVERLNALRRAQILDSAPEQAFDEITERAAEICGTPIALISLVDEKRQWFKSRQGTELTETPRDMAFCSHTIRQDELMIVPDALADERFRDNPLVTGEPYLRFYAGVPLVMGDGNPLGTLCVVDHQPRELTEEQKSNLLSLAESTKLLFEMRSSPMGEIFSKAVQATVEGVTVVDAKQPGMPVIFANQAFYRITGYHASQVLGRNLNFLCGPDTDPRAFARIQAAVARKENCVVELLAYRQDGSFFWNRASLAPLLDADGQLAYVTALHSDVTETRKAEAARHKLDGMITAMNTVNDVVFNFMTSLQLFRMDMEECAHADPAILREFDTIFETTHAKLSKINALKSFKSKVAVDGIAVLDTG